MTEQAREPLEKYLIPTLSLQDRTISEAELDNFLGPPDDHDHVRR
mgnify:CR=1 FL=1